MMRSAPRKAFSFFSCRNFDPLSSFFVIFRALKWASPSFVAPVKLILWNKRLSHNVVFRNTLLVSSFDTLHNQICTCSMASYVSSVSSEGFELVELMYAPMRYGFIRIITTLLCSGFCVLLGTQVLGVTLVLRATSALKCTAR